MRKKYRIRPADQADRDGWKRGTGEWFEALDAYCRALEWDTIPRGSIYLNPRQFVEGFQDGKTGVFDRTDGKPPAPGEAVELMSRDAVERYIRENPGISVQSKITCSTSGWKTGSGRNSGEGSQIYGKGAESHSPGITGGGMGKKYGSAPFMTCTGVFDAAAGKGERTFRSRSGNLTCMIWRRWPICTGGSGKRR